jgi:hypothetical protein
VGCGGRIIHDLAAGSDRRFSRTPFKCVTGFVTPGRFSLFYGRGIPQSVATADIPERPDWRATAHWSGRFGVHQHDPKHGKTRTTSRPTHDVTRYPP